MQMREMVDPTPRFWAGSSRDLNNWFGELDWEMMVASLFYEQLKDEIETTMSIEDQMKY